MAYFRCGQGSGGGGGVSFTIEIETDSQSLFGQSITISKEGTTVGITVFDNTGHAEYVVDEPGTYRASCTYSGVTFYDEVTFSTTETATIYATPDGSTVTPTDAVPTLLQCANVWDKNYTTMSQLLADTTTLLTVISSDNAIDYLVRSRTWCTDVCADSTAMTYIGTNNYAANTLLADLGSGNWMESICNSANFESVLNAKVPTMTSDTTPSGECVGSTPYAENVLFHAFDGNLNTLFNSYTQNANIGYIFTSPIMPVMATMQYSNTTYAAGFKTFNVEGQENGSWTTIKAFENVQSGVGPFKYILDNTNEYDGVRIYGLHNQGAATVDQNYAVNILQFYGRVDV